MKSSKKTVPAGTPLMVISKKTIGRRSISSLVGANVDFRLGFFKGFFLFLFDGFFLCGVVLRPMLLCVRPTALGPIQNQQLIGTEFFKKQSHWDSQYPFL